MYILIVVGGIYCMMFLIHLLSSLTSTNKEEFAEHLRHCVAEGQCQVKQNFIHRHRERISWAIIERFGPGGKTVVWLANYLYASLLWPLFSTSLADKL